MTFFENIIDFIFVKDKTILQDVFLSSLSIPLVWTFFNFLLRWWKQSRPLSLILKGYKDSETEVLVFLSQLSSADKDFVKNQDQQYIIEYPHPLPTNKKNLTIAPRHNIDPVWSEADGLCVADVFNILGRIKKIKNIKIASLIKDWDRRENPIFTIGFNPKTDDLIKESRPIYFKLNANQSLSVEGLKDDITAYTPNDGGIIQKTFIKDTKTPVIILAGLGTTGTEVAGSLFNKKAKELGKLYGDRSFCLAYKADISKGRNYFNIQSIFPSISFLNILCYPITYLRWKKFIK